MLFTFRHGIPETGCWRLRDREHTQYLCLLRLRETQTGGVGGVISTAERCRRVAGAIPKNIHPRLGLLQPQYTASDTYALTYGILGYLKDNGYAEHYSDHGWKITNKVYRSLRGEVPAEQSIKQVKRLLTLTFLRLNKEINNGY